MLVFAIRGPHLSFSLATLFWGPTANSFLFLRLFVVKTIHFLSLCQKQELFLLWLVLYLYSFFSDFRTTLVV